MRREGVKNWYLYVLRCRDGSYYTGITTDVARRLEEHGSGKGAKYTSSRRPVELVHREVVGSRSEALRKEHAFKRLSRQEKEGYLSEHGKERSGEVSQGIPNNGETHLS